MRSVIVCISGASRTGKDTIIGHACRVLHSEKNLSPMQVFSVSSIDDAKHFMDAVASKLGLDEPTKGELNRSHRQGLADMKRGLDIAMNYSIVLPHTLLGRQPGKGGIMFYQVREPENIRALRSVANGDDLAINAYGKGLSESCGGPAVVWVHVLRPGRGYEPEASTDQYRELRMDEPDIVATNTGLASLLAWGGLIASLAHDRMLSAAPFLQTSAKAKPARSDLAPDTMVDAIR